MKTEQERVDAARAFLERRGFVVARSKNAIKDHLLTQDEAAEVLGVSRNTFMGLRRQGWFPKPISLGKHSLRYFVDELLQAMQQNAPRQDVGEEPAQLKAARDRQSIETEPSP